MSGLPVLQSDRLTLRQVRVSDAEALFEILSDNELMTWWAFGPHRSIEETRAMLEPVAAEDASWRSWAITRTGEDITYLRLAFFGRVSEPDPTLELDEGIVRAVWMTADEIRACPERHRSPLVLECLESYLAGQRYPLDLLTVHESVFTAPSHHRAA